MENKKPIIEVTRGKVQVAIWTQTNDDGTLCGVTVGRFYRDGDNWKSSERISVRDLLLAAKAFDQSHSWLLEHAQHEKK